MVRVPLEYVQYTASSGYVDQIPLQFWGLYVYIIKYKIYIFVHYTYSESCGEILVYVSLRKIVKILKNCCTQI